MEAMDSPRWTHRRWEGCSKQPGTLLGCPSRVIVSLSYPACAVTETEALMLAEKTLLPLKQKLFGNLRQSSQLVLADLKS